MPCCQFTLFKFDWNPSPYFYLRLSSEQSHFYPTSRCEKNQKLGRLLLIEENETEVLKFGLVVWMYKWKWSQHGMQFDGCLKELI